MIATLLLATAAMLPPLTQLNTGAPVLGSGSPAAPFTFVVAGDNRPDKGQGDLAPAFQKLVAKIASSSSPPAFILWDGDTIPGKDPAKVDKQYDEFLGVLTANLKNTPVFNAPGNHELALKTSDCTDAPDTSGQLLTKYVNDMGPAYGMFQYGNSAFIAVNTDDALGSVQLPSGKCPYNGFVSATQLAALKATLAQLSGQPSIKHVFIFMHRPVYDDNSHQIGGDKSTPYGQEIEEFRNAMKALASPPVSFIFASHDHRLYVHPKDKKHPNGPFKNKAYTRFLITGGAGAPLAGCKDGGKGKAGAYFHWLSVTVNGDDVTVNVDPLTDMTLCGAP